MDASAQWCFWKDPKNISEEILEVQADATAEQNFSKRPPQFVLSLGSSESGRNWQQVFLEGP